ncbi:MAG: hypothetical protein H0U71_03970 [Gammaproteobacteria bacterium]|nr:hypothetical protein [Gammaproteobacteria bacterium]
MQETIEQSFDEVVNYFLNHELANAKTPLPQNLLDAIKLIMAKGDSSQKLTISECFAAAILDGRVVDRTNDDAINLIKHSLGNSSKKLPHYLYNRILRAAASVNQSTATTYLSICFELNEYHALPDLSYVLLSNKYSQNIDDYIQKMSEFLNSALEQRHKNKLTTTIYYVMKNTVVYPEVRERSIKLLQTILACPAWTDSDTARLQKAMSQLLKDQPTVSVSELKRSLDATLCEATAKALSPKGNRQPD